MDERGVRIRAGGQQAPHDLADPGAPARVAAQQSREAGVEDRLPAVRAGRLADRRWPRCEPPRDLLRLAGRARAREVVAGERWVGVQQRLARGAGPPTSPTRSAPTARSDGVECHAPRRGTSAAARSGTRTRVRPQAARARSTGTRPPCGDAWPRRAGGAGPDGTAGNAARTCRTPFGLRRVRTPGRKSRPTPATSNHCSQVGLRPFPRTGCVLHAALTVPPPYVRVDTGSSWRSVDCDQL